MEKRFWIVLVVIVAALVGVFIFTAPKNNNNTGSYKSNGDLNSVQSYDHVRGSKSNKVVLVEYGDFQCPACEAYFPTETAAYDKYGKVVTFVYRDFPLTQLHPNAYAAARAAEAADKQGKFWEMHDKLYSNQQLWVDDTQTAPTTFANFAEQLGLNVSQFKQDYASTDVNDKINNFMANGSSQGVTGTPTLILNGKTISNPTPSDPSNFYKQIEAAIKAAGLKVPAATSSSSTTQ